MGATECNNRKNTFKVLSPFLEQDAREFWTKNEKKVGKGVLYQGAIERCCYFVSYVIKMLKGFRNVDKLMNFTNLQEQIHFVDNVWDTTLWRKSFDLALHPSITKKTWKDPGLDSTCDNIKPSNYLYSRMQEALRRGLAKENPLISLILNGKVPPEAYPPYLTNEGVGAIQKRLGRISTHTQDIVSFLESAKPESFDCFSLSDVASYLTPENYVRMLKAIIKTAKPNARFCLRQFLSGYAIPPELQHHFVRDKALEDDVEKNDRCFVYRYMIGEVKK
jgi:S-adenosylmethionine-diacylglycerol 3-amino-3-carboxypropyl transferase